MKYLKRTAVLVLALALLAGVFPAVSLTAAAEEPVNLEAKASRMSVMLGADGLLSKDTLVLGYAWQGSTDAAAPASVSSVYPLQWQIADASADSLGRTGGKLLVSEYLLPSAETDDATGGIDTESYTYIPLGENRKAVISMPDDAAVLRTYKADGDYVANLGSNYLGDYEEYGAAPAAGLFTKGNETVRGERTLSGAEFFALSAEETETYIPNKNKTGAVLFRRPYAAGYAFESVSDRSWALRSATAQEDPCYVGAAVSDPEYTPEIDGLIFAGSPEASYLSRPAFNLRSNAVSFVYQVKPTVKEIGGKANVTESRMVIGEQVEKNAATTVSGTATWRAALETLPMFSASAVYHQDGSVEIEFSEAAKGYKVGMLVTDADGKVLSWGTSRITTKKEDGAKLNDNVIFTPQTGEAAYWLYTFDYNETSGQLYTSPLVKIAPAEAASMTLGAAHIKDGEKVWLGYENAFIGSAETGSTGMANTGSSGSMTKTGDINDEYPVRPEEAIFLVGKISDTNYAPDCGCNGALAADTIPFLQQMSLEDPEKFPTEVEKLRELLKTKSYNSGEDLRYYNNQFFNGYTECDLLFGENYNVMLNALAFTWGNDTAYDVDVYYDYYSSVEPGTKVTVASDGRALNAAKLFPLSAGEFMALPETVRKSLGNIILRNSVTEIFHEHFVGGQNETFEATSSPAFTAEGKIATFNSFYELASPVAFVAPGFNLRKDHIVYMVQANAANKELTTVSGLHEVPAYSSSCTEWEMAILDDTIGPLVVERLDTYPNDKFNFGFGNAVASSLDRDSFISVLITDAAGNVKKYGRIHEFGYHETDIVPGVQIDPQMLSFGDRVYAINEYEADGAEHPIVYASAPVLLYEKKLDGAISVSPEPHLPGEDMILDDSEVKADPGEVLEYCWYHGDDTFYGLQCNAGTWTGDYTVRAVLSYPDPIYPGSDTHQYLAVKAAAETSLPVYPGSKNQDDFSGGTLYYGPDGPDGADNYVWTIVGKPTKGVEKVADTTNDPYYTSLSVSNALEIIRNEATTFAQQDILLSDYMERTVLRTDIDDPYFEDRYVVCMDDSLTNQRVFRPSYQDYLKLKALNDPSVLFAAPADSSTEAAYALRNHDDMDCYVTVDAVQKIQQEQLAVATLTREAVNVNQKRIVFYSPAALNLTYDSLKNVRQNSTDDWKLTVMDPESFSDTKIVNISTSGSQVSVRVSADSENSSRYVTAWAVKNGKIVWLDSVPCAKSGENDYFLPIEAPENYDDVYAVVRLDNGAYHSDVCTVPSAATPVPITVQIFINGVRTDYGCSYDITDVHGAETTRFSMHETAIVRIHDIRGGYTFDRMTLLYPGREDIMPESDIFGNYVSEVLIDGIDPIVRIYLKAEKYPIRAYVYTVDADGFKYLDEVGGTVKIPSEAFYNETFEYTVTPYRGYFVKEISYDENGRVNSVDVKKQYQSATYTDRMGSAGRTYVITMQKLPTYQLTLLADPEEGGTITAEIPKSAKRDAMVEGDWVVLHAEPVEGWSLTGITYHLGTDGEEKELIADPEEGYVFTMPASDVVITAHFAAKHTITSAFLDISGTTPLPVSAASAVYSVNGEPTEYFSGGEEVTATVTCAANLAVFSTEATPETALTQTDKYTFTFTMPDDDLQITYNFKKLAIKSAYLHLNEDINIIYTVQVPKGFTEPTAEFTFMGKSYPVTDYFVDEQGKYCFEFKQVTPQYMGEPIDITVSAAMGDYTYTHSTTGYSIRKYCQNMLGKSTDELLNTLLSDTLCYGAASQKFVSYKTDELVTDGIDNLKPSKYPGLSGLKPTFVGTEDPNVKWESVALRLSNNMCMDYTFYAASTENLSVTITVDGRMQTFTTFEPVEGKTNFYRICYRGIYASEFGATVSASFHRDGEKVGNTLKYCVNAYVCSKQDAEGPLGPLVKTIYNYGVSALTYYNERILKK